ncbi:unnamed protein product [Bursaphelenchus okinawaensis]|uniref:Laminin subunit beta-1 n=1 Tax=Bursaphelenchus okinawaensis TaxID=465554 RepID=A0A811KWW9_9BILA|nr:unnamed protein product [Bursaphelenchus okinawaensis]CAG9112472.1 unnamed protein product [Bursaphelenchus okinawaensis]
MNQTGIVWQESPFLLAVCLFLQRECPRVEVTSRDSLLYYLLFSVRAFSQTWIPIRPTPVLAIRPTTQKWRQERPPLSYLIQLSMLFLCILPQTTSELAAEEEDLCQGRSCYPATGNLLIGRKDKITATSTCGTGRRERYCIVSHLEDQTKCFFCDSRQEWLEDRDPNRLSHRIQNVVTESYEERAKSWWQSKNGEQNVSIRIDFDEEFHVTHFILTFRTFRPAAMFIEHSADYGKTWRVDRYFAYDCDKAFPGIPEGRPKKHGDVICTSKYSSMSPSNGGELIYKVISPYIHTDDPYAPEIANLLKMTNIRLNFTKLHTLGDDLLDYRPEIDEKYYYALYEIVVRGSCSCYGHAQKCVPKWTGDDRENSDMVHGNCECTHNTQGANCEKCKDFYHDLPWKPAIGDESNECKICRCNNHAASCHFDESEYIKSGNVSGGVCDDCQHNTQGKNCDQCLPYFYRDPARRIDDPYACRPCECDKRGSKYDGICEGEENINDKKTAGTCYCKTHVDGPRCDRCKNGFWNFTESNPDGCQECGCDLLGTVDNLGCDKYTGGCTCKKNVIGERCDTCKPDHYGLSNHTDGCLPCNCDVGASVSTQCDAITGNCECKNNFGGPKCNVPLSGFFCPAIDHHTYDAEDSSEVTGGEVITRAAYSGQHKTWSGDGFVQIREGTNISFVVNNIFESGQYNIIIRYELPNDGAGWDNIMITVVRPDSPSPDGPCANSITSDDFLIARLVPQTTYYEIHPSICLEKDVEYKILMFFGERIANHHDPQAQALIDSVVLIPPTDNLDIFSGSHEAQYKGSLFAQCRPSFLRLTPKSHVPQQCIDLICTVAGAIIHETKPCNCDLTGSLSSICDIHGGKCQCKPNVIGDKCDRCAPETYGFGPTGCTPCGCDSSGAWNNECDKQSGQCECRDKGIYGRQCNQCQPGFWSFPDCKTCQCNGHATVCDQERGACIDCHNHTTGHNCERCIDTYYGDPRLGVGEHCKPCPCPGGPGSGLQNANTCYLDRNALESKLKCNCKPGYTGDRCDACEVNHWGSPRDIGGQCVECDCNGNIDKSVPGSCDPKTGHCVKCLHNTDGIECENCKEGFFGDAKTRSCHQCVCNSLGTNTTAGACDRVTGQCHCYPDVVGQQCDQCAPQHFDLASGKGCQACECDPLGVIDGPDGQPHLECNKIDGKCQCKEGRGGRTCSECQDYYWGNPLSGECKRCECDPTGSASYQCHRNNGTCICKPGSGGPLCNQCARGYTGNWPHCQACGECFDNWDKILTGLRDELDQLVERANNIEDTGVSSEYDETFEKMEVQINGVKTQLEAVNISKEDVEGLRKKIDSLEADVSDARSRVLEKNEKVLKIASDVDIAEQQVTALKAKADDLTKMAEDLSKQADDIRGSDTKGAYDIVRESAEKVRQSHGSISEAIAKITSAESDRNKAADMMETHKNEFLQQYDENKAALDEIQKRIEEIEESLPTLNKQVCGGETAGCDETCGGPSSECGKCGGSSCLGSVSKAKQAGEFAREAREKLLAKQKEAEELLQRIRDTVPETNAAERSTSEALRNVEQAVKLANHTKDALNKQLDEIKQFIDSERTGPEQLQNIVNEILSVSIPFTEEQIKEMSDKIKEKVSSTKNTDEILAETQDNKTLAENLQKQADSASQRAAKIHNTTVAINKALEDANAAYNEAQSVLDQTAESNDQISADLEKAEGDVVTLEEKAKEATTLISELQNKTDKLKAEYIKITSNSKSAGASADKALEIAQKVEENQAPLKAKYDEVDKLLSERVSGNEEKKERAEKLHRRTTELLVNIKKHNSDAEALKRTADSLDVELSNFRSTVEVLSRQIDEVASEIEKRVEFHATCDA